MSKVSSLYFVAILDTSAKAKGAPKKEHIKDCTSSSGVSCDAKKASLSHLTLSKALDRDSRVGEKESVSSVHAVTWKLALRLVWTSLYSELRLVKHFLF